MKRRAFIASTGATAGTLFGTFEAYAAPIPLSAAKLQEIEIAIKGSFGSGFALVSAEQANGWITAVIEHNENHLKVASTDLVDWSILRATDM